MDQSEFELQLNVWKDLAISKQVLIGAATDALGLDPDCSTDELRDALDTATKKAKDAEERIKQANTEARESVVEMERKMIAAENARKTAEAERDQAKEALDVAEKQLASERAGAADELKKAKAETAEKQKSIKAIHVALADTPENVVKKMKALKKQKMDESNSKKRLEGELRQLKKEKQKVEKERQELQELVNNSAELMENVKEHQKLAGELHQQLTEKLGDDNELAPLPALNEEIIEAISKAASKD